jgi:modulator of FtsH protease
MQPTYSIQHADISGNRSLFLGKVFSLFGLSLLFSLLGVYIGIQIVEFYPWLFMNNITFYSIFALELILIFTSRWWSQTRGLNYGLFLLFTVLSGFTAVPILMLAHAYGGAWIIMKALGATVALFAGIGLYGYVTKRDLSGMGGFLFLSLIGIIIASIVNIFVQSTFFEYMLSWIVVIIFSGFVMYDVQMIKTRYTDDMYIQAALALYLDFFNLFINILNILMGSSRN